VTGWLVERGQRRRPEACGGREEDRQDSQSAHERKRKEVGEKPINVHRETSGIKL
jgi:hypothetical protein